MACPTTDAVLEVRIPQRLRVFLEHLADEENAGQSAAQYASDLLEYELETMLAFRQRAERSG